MATDVLIACLACNYVGDAGTFAPNMSSYHNALRCSVCGSTRNTYNQVWSRHISEVMAGTREGPATHAAAMDELAAKTQEHATTIEGYCHTCRCFPDSCDLSGDHQHHFGMHGRRDG